MSPLANNLGKGIYSIPEAARLTAVPAQTARSWFVPSASTSSTAPVLHLDYPVVDHRRAISFLDLVDLLIVGGLRKAGVSFQTVRKVHRALIARFDSCHPFGAHRLYTDGMTVFIEMQSALGDLVFEEVVARQGAMKPILREYLSQIDYSRDSGMAERWRIAEGVVIDPRLCFGKPVLAASAISTSILASFCAANHGDAELVADLYGVAPDEVRVAVAFEHSLEPGRAA